MTLRMDLCVRTNSGVSAHPPGALVASPASRGAIIDLGSELHHGHGCAGSREMYGRELDALIAGGGQARGLGDVIRRPDSRFRFVHRSRSGLSRIGGEQVFDHGSG